MIALFRDGLLTMRMGSLEKRDEQPSVTSCRCAVIPRLADRPPIPRGA